MKDKLREQLQHFYPGYFALVMATGIVSIASKTFHYETIANLLFYLNNFFFVILVTIYFCRFTFFTKEAIGDLKSHSSGPGYLTVVAGSCILGTSYLKVQDLYSPAAFLFWFGSILSISEVFYFVALIAWLLILVSMVVAIFRPIWQKEI